MGTLPTYEARVTMVPLAMAPVQLYLTHTLFQDIIEVDAETKEMLKMMDFQSIPGLQMTTAGILSTSYCHFFLSPHYLFRSRWWQPQLPGKPQLERKHCSRVISDFLMPVIPSALTCAELSRSRLISDLISERSRWLREERIRLRTP